MTGVSFVAPRSENKTAYGHLAVLARGTDQIFSWLYRIRPSVAHRGFTPLALNADVRTFVLYLGPTSSPK